ncbi:MAG TPA: protein-disulfide reductase DsbD domain-containing protein [Candidatus Saccharimonadales bacterium]|nr:protein-disulfide reductase DsbD domain-containing protein [Candidatus Saccharimonadales bacterium]
MLDADGRVERSLAEENYRVRSGGRRLLTELLGTSAGAPVDAPSATAREAVVSASVRLDSPTYYAYQRLGLQIDLTIAPGWHIYGPMTPDGYTPLAVTVTSVPAGVRVGPIAWPATRPFQVAGLDDGFAVYDGTVRLDVPVEFIIQRDSGEAGLEVTVAFQACSATECFAPAAITAALAVPEAPTL